MMARWASRGAAIVLAVSLFVAPRLAIAQGTGNAAAVSHGIGNVDFDAPKQSPKDSPPPPDSAKIGMAAAPGLIEAAHVPCTLSEARFMFGAIGADKGKAKVYEVACQEGLGYVIVAPEKADATPVIFDCMATTQPVGGKPNPMACKLAGNADPAKGLSALMARSGRACAVDKGRYLGSTEDRNVYEVACHEGGGYILEAAKAPGGRTTANTCLAYGAASNLRCILQTPEQQQGAVAGLVAASGKPCAMTNTGYRGFTAADLRLRRGRLLRQQGAHAGGPSLGQACGRDRLSAGRRHRRRLHLDRSAAGADRPGRILQRSGQGNLQRPGQAGWVRLRRFPNMPTSLPRRTAEVVELACSNRSDGGVGLFSTTGRPEVWDCLRAHAEGYTCSFSSESNVYGKLTNQLKAKGTNCVVSDARPYGRTSAGADLIEVSCADGGPGWVLEYPPHVAEPSGALRNCAQAAASGGSGCQLAANKAHA